MGIIPDFRKSICRDISSVDSLVAQREMLEELTAKYSERMGHKLGCTNVVEHKIITEGEPIRLRPYRYSPGVQKRIDEEIEIMLKEDTIEPLNSTRSSPVLLVPKGNDKWRFCVDYRALNQITKNVPIPFLS
ncbi:hypothetical protein JTB14_030323 [Gonioctena quinquepunctata]|nr:hypothetical protein JTB14_030323 [Gonioctena quinquepunctata]